MSPKPPTERTWERATRLEAITGPSEPPFVCDGGGLPFPPQALLGPAEPLDESDPTVALLRDYLQGRVAASQPKKRRPWQRAPAEEPTTAPAPAPAIDLAGWRLLAREPREILFGRGLPPRLLTVAMHEETRPTRWIVLGSTANTPLRATKDGIRASSWRLDPEVELTPESTELRILLREQGFAAGQRADGRILPPELYATPERLVLTLFVTPREGWQNRSKNPETPVRIALPEPLGQRVLVDGAIIGATSEPQ
jgi:hypothetical protein